MSSDCAGCKKRDEWVFAVAHVAVAVLAFRELAHENGRALTIMWSVCAGMNIMGTLRAIQNAATTKSQT